jgi:uncharacterized protein
LSSLATIGLTIFVVTLFIGIYFSLFGLPGTVIIFVDVLVYAILTGFNTLSFTIILFLLVFSIIAEAIDFLSGMAGALRPLPSKRMFWVSAVGAVAGSFILTPLLLGLGTFAGFFLGCFAGILIEEFIRQSRLQTPFKASYSSIFAMVGGKIAKGFIALIMIAVSLSNIYS